MSAVCAEPLPSREEDDMKNQKIIIACAAAVALVLLGALGFCLHSIRSLRTELTEAQQQENLLVRRVEEIRETSDQEKQSLLEKIDALLAEQVIEFDAGTMQEEVRDIGELATVEYRYTNVGTLDATKKFKFIDWTIPFTKKDAVVTMDGVLKAGIDFSAVKISSTGKNITVTIPFAQILSNELDEDSLSVYEESDGLFNRISLEDDSGIRSQIKAKAEQNARDNDLLKQARDNAADILRYMIESVPGVKGNYYISFR